jgi:uncharacterized protein (TIGR01244 family)
MMRRLFLALLLAGPIACAGDATPTTVRANLDTVVAQGQATPVDGITSAGQPDEAALRVFSESGYVAVIDMRGPGEDRGFDEASTVAGLGMDYITLPIEKGDITFDKARELDAILARYDQPVLLHCGSGNRVGAMLALREFLASGDAGKALQKGRDAGLTRLETEVRKVLDDAAGQ